MAHITISEVGLRDGLQSVDTIRQPKGSSPDRSRVRCGCQRDRSRLFVSPKLLPQMADTAAVVKDALRHQDLAIAVLVPNLRGCEAAVEAGAHKLIPLSLSEAHSIKTCDVIMRKCSGDRGLSGTGRSGAEADRPDLEVGLSTAFGCTIVGAVKEAFVIDMAERVLGLGIAEVGLSDTTGMGNPAQLERLVTGIWQRCGESHLTGVHLHNTRGLGLANALAPELGIVDSSSVAWAVARLRPAPAVIS